MTTPPPLDEQLAAHARERHRDDELLEGLAAGTLTPGDRALLERRATEDPEFRAAVELCQPLGDPARDRVVDRLIAPASNVVPLRPRSPRTWVVATIALAAGLAAVVLLPRVLRGDPSIGYSLEVSGDAEVRGAAPTSQKVAPGSHLTLVARPARATTRPTSARVFVSTPPAHDFTPLDAEVQLSEDGAVRVEVLGANLGAPGPHVVRLLLGEGTSAISLESAVELTP